MVDFKVFGARVRRLRSEKNWNQQELARRAGVSLGTLSSLETAKRSQRWSSMEAVAAALGTTIAWLLQTQEPITESDPRLQMLTDEDLRVARAFHDSTTWTRQHVLRMLFENTDPAMNLIRLPEDEVIAVLESDQEEEDPSGA